MCVVRAEATNARVAWFSVGSLLICVVLAAWQLYYLKQFFHKCVDISSGFIRAFIVGLTHTAFRLLNFTDTILCMLTGRSCCERLTAKQSTLGRGSSQHTVLLV